MLSISKYQVGDKLIVKKNLELDKEYCMEDSDYSNNIVLEMQEFEGEEVTIAKVFNNAGYSIEEDNNTWCWTDEMFECLTEDVDKQEEIEENNLKTYEMVALANENGKTYINEDMKYNKELGFHDELNEEWKIEAFYDYGLNYFINMDGWKELVKPKLTKEELVKIVGYDFDIVE